MFMVIALTFFSIQALAILLVIGACSIAAAADRRAVRPYVRAG